MKKQKIFFLTLFCVLQSFVSSFAQTNGWYKAKEIGNKTWVIKEPGFDENMYLIEGRDSSLLIDTGFGMGNLRDFVKKLTSKPLIVVNTHSHPDHTGGNYQFPVVHIGTNDLELAKPLLDRNVTKQIVMQALGSIQIADSLKFPASENPNTTLIPVNDNHVFKLGNRDVKVISVIGHTPGGIFMLDKKNKLLFTGDNMAVTWLFFKESLTVETYKKSLQKLDFYKNKFNIMHTGHGEPLDISILAELKECCEQILNGRCEAKPYRSMIGIDGISCSHKSVTIAYDPNKIR